MELNGKVMTKRKLKEYIEGGEYYNQFYIIPTIYIEWDYFTDTTDGKKKFTLNIGLGWLRWYADLYIYDNTNYYDPLEKIKKENIL